MPLSLLRSVYLLSCGMGVLGLISIFWIFSCLPDVFYDYMYSTLGVMRLWAIFHISGINSILSRCSVIFQCGFITVIIFSYVEGIKSRLGVMNYTLSTSFLHIRRVSKYCAIISQYFLVVISSVPSSVLKHTLVVITLSYFL